MPIGALARSYARGAHLRPIEASQGKRGEPSGAPQCEIGGGLNVHRGACGAIWAPARERGAHLRHLGVSLMPELTYGGAHVQKRGAL